VTRPFSRHSVRFGAETRFEASDNGTASENSTMAPKCGEAAAGAACGEGQQ
jgi:hypothetical protein